MKEDPRITAIRKRIISILQNDISYYREEIKKLNKDFMKWANFIFDCEMKIKRFEYLINYHMKKIRV